MSLVHGISTVIKHGKWSRKSKKRTGHVFYMATPSHATESEGAEVKAYLKAAQDIAKG